MIMVLKCIPNRIHDWGVVLALVWLPKFSATLTYSLMMFGCVILTVTVFYQFWSCFCYFFMVAVNDEVMNSFYFLALTRLESKSTCLFAHCDLGSNWYLVVCTAVAVTSYAWYFVCHLSNYYCCDQMVLHYFLNLILLLYLNHFGNQD